MRFVTTERLVLEPVDVRNAKELWRILGAPDLRRFQDIPRVRAEEFERQVRSRPRALRDHATGRFEWIIRTVQDSTPVGWISLRINERTSHIAEIGYSLVEEARGSGYASEAVAAIVNETFMTTQINELQACCVPENESSRAVLDRTHFRESRLLKSGAMIRGRHVDIMLYTLDRGEWTRSRREQIAGTG
jgi:[ribosomal protein S5]-alanine N-acetyltransferase